MSDKKMSIKLKNKVMYENNIYKSNRCGYFKVLEYLESKKVKIIFLTTGYTCYTQLVHIKRGTVSDKLHTSLYNKGYIGVGKYKAHIQGRYTKIYSIWSGMLKRCYSEKVLKAHPTYAGCTVVDVWHNFQNFAKWFEENYVEGYQLDKDIKVEGNKVYGPDTCMFVTRQKNSEKAQAKNYTLLDPEGVRVDVYNLSAFCKDHQLSLDCMYGVCAGYRPQHKGWKVYKVEE